MVQGGPGAIRAVREWFGRMAGRRRGRGGDLDPLDPSLRVVACARDEAESCSAILDRAAAGAEPWEPGAPVLSRHHLLAPADAVPGIVGIAAQTGYGSYEGDVPRPGVQDGGAGDVASAGGRAVVTLARVERLDALHLAQERSRMAGLAQRWGGAVVGWDALQPGA